MATIELERLPYNVLKDILVEGFKQIEISVQDTTAYRIAYLSDKFAHFTHLIGLKMALAALDELTIPDSADSPDLIERAIRGAVQDTEAVVKEAYEHAIQKYRSYEPVLWAVADHWQLLRSTRDIYTSYVRICADLNAKGGNVEIVDKSKLSKFLYNMKQPTHGQVLVSERKSWFKIRMSMLRGYCRIVAQARGIDVGLKYLESDRVRPPPATASASRIEATSEDDASGDTDDAED